MLYFLLILVLVETLYIIYLLTRKPSKVLSNLQRLTPKIPVCQFCKEPLTGQVKRSTDGYWGCESCIRVRLQQVPVVSEKLDRIDR